MASASRVAQEKLTELEKTSAPFRRQLLEAAKFVGVELEVVGRGTIEKKKGNTAAYHGKEEWLLRWLLKKLQDPKDATPRLTASVWWLFCHLLQNIPLSIVARLLIERKFTTILRLTLEDATKGLKEPTSIEHLQSDSGSDSDGSSRPSKKRKRSPGLAPEARKPLPEERISELLDALHRTLYFITQSTKVTIDTSEEGKGAAFTAEYLRTAIKALAQDAAMVLGLWLSLSSQALKWLVIDDRSTWLSPFIEVWAARMAADSELILFSRHCLAPLMLLLREIKAESYPHVITWTTQMEQLVAHNVMISAKAGRIEGSDSDLFPTLVRLPVIQVTANAPVFFDIAIRCISTRGTQRRQPHDEDWLQHVFTTLQNALLPQRPEENNNALCAMLESAKTYKVDIDLLTLRKITTSFAFTQDRTEWQLVAKLIALDANTFLIPDNETDLLNKLLQRITMACFEPEWVSIIEPVVLGVLVPLMREFANARDLTGFIHHWYAQLVKFETLREEKKLVPMEHFSAWENEALQFELRNHFVQSLTINQIKQILDWLQVMVTENPNATCLILEAIAGSAKVTDTDVVDAINTRLFDIMFETGDPELLHSRYKWRSWRILSQSLDRSMENDLATYAELWSEGARPFDSLANQLGSAKLLQIEDDNKISLDSLEMLRCACAAWTCTNVDAMLADLARPLVLDFLNRLANELKTFPEDLIAKENDYGLSVCDERQDTVRRDIAWMMWSFVRCIFVEYPKVHILVLELTVDTPKAFLRNIFWLASGSDRSDVAWFRGNPDAWPSLWTSALQNDYVLDSPPLISLMIDNMLEVHSNHENPCRIGPENNKFALQSLLHLPLHLFSREQREHVLANWHPGSWKSDATTDKHHIRDSSVAALDPALLALKVKIARRSAFYEGMDFQHMVDLADALARLKRNDQYDSPKPYTSLYLLKEYIRLTLSHVLEHVDQSRSQAYILASVSSLRQMLAITTKRNPLEIKQWTFPFIALSDVIFNALRPKLTILEKLEIIDTKEFQKLAAEFKRSLLAQFGVSLEKGIDLEKQDKSSLLLLCALDALTSLGVEASELEDYKGKAKAFIKSSDIDPYEAGKKVELFMAIHGGALEKKSFGTRIKGDVSTVFGRQSIIEQARAATTGKNEKAKLKLLDSMIGEGLIGLTEMDKLLAIRQVIVSCEDSRPANEEDEDKFDLSTSYSGLCGQLWKVKELRQFCFISETMELMIRTKGRCMIQWNIDSTLGSITMICSRNGPALRPQDAGAIFLHLCRLLQAILISHRLKLQSHFHLVVQTMQALLRCLFTPLRHSSSTSKSFDPPPWLPSSSHHQLGPKHAEAYTRLLTLICNPSVSAVTRSQHNALTSATDKAKRMAGQHMQFVLTLYIRLQLEMRMQSEVREVLMPGIYALFDTTTPEMRRMVGEGLDASGRAVFARLVGEYLKFGKWKGS